MNKIFKVSLVAAAVALSGSVVAGELTATKADYSKEGLSVANAATPNNSVAMTGTADYKAGTAYVAGTNVTIALTPGALAAGFVFPTTGFNSTRTIASKAYNHDGDAGTADVAGTCVLTKSDILGTPARIDSDTAKYTVKAPTVVASANASFVAPTGATAANPTDPCVAQPEVSETSFTTNDVMNVGAAFSALTPLLGTYVASSPVSMTITAAYSSGAELDPNTKNSALLTTVKSQFGKITADTPFNAKIDVSKAREALVGTPNSDTASFTLTANTTGVNAFEASSKATFTLDADLSGFAVDKDGLVTGVTTTLVDATAPKYDDAKKQVTFSTTTSTDAIAPFDIVITPPVTDATAETTAATLQVQSFALDVEFTYATDKKASIDSSAGSWSLNGSSGTIEYMPFGNTISQIIYVTNKGTVEGAITGEAIVNGEKIDLGDLGTATAKTVTPIAGKIKAALEAAGVTGSAKARLSIVVNSPSSDIKIYASYNVGGSDRGFVPVAHTN